MKKEVDKDFLQNRDGLLDLRNKINQMTKDGHVFMIDEEYTRAIQEFNLNKLQMEYLDSTFGVGDGIEFKGILLDEINTSK